jgi:hypothetical protein
MMKYTRANAKSLYAELQDVLRGIPRQIDDAQEDGPTLTIICEGLGKAIAALKTRV